ncbi:MAG: hypothetical protein AAF745_09675, partial [Planctomycetota bacterium]
MRTDKNTLDDLDRLEQAKTRKRRQNRARRAYRTGLLAFGVVALLIIGGPSLISRLGIARSILTSQAEQYDLIAEAESIDVGWITPLSVRGLTIVGASRQTHFSVSQIDTTLTLTDLIWLDPATLGEVTIRGVKVDGVVRAGGSSIEDDMSIWLSSESD